MKRLIALLLVGIPVLAFGADKQNPDHDFFTQAAEAGLAEVDLGKLAEKKAADPAVKQFAAEMVKDHSSANDKLKNLAQEKGVPLPSDLTTAQKASRKTLEMQSAADFDQAYIKNQVDAHEDTIALLKKEIASGKDNEAKALAQSMLPIVQGHLQQVQQLEKATAGNDRTPNKMIDRTAETGSVHHADQ